MPNYSQLVNLKNAKSEVVQCQTSIVLKKAGFSSTEGIIESR